MTNDDMSRLLLESLASNGSGLNGNAGQLQELIAGLNNPDQMTNLLVQYLTKRQAEAQIDPPPLEEDSDWLPGNDEREYIDLQDEEKERARRWQEKSRRMQAELSALRERNDLLAEALGACFLCWGEYPDCQECRGRGRSGSRPLNRELFKQYISPAMSRLHTTNDVRKRRRTGKKTEPESETLSN